MLFFNLHGTLILTIYLTSLHTYRITAAKGAYSGTDITLYGWSIYDVNITLNVTFWRVDIFYIDPNKYFSYYFYLL